MENFDAIDVNRGLDVYITKSNENSITVQADENLHDIISTEIKNDVLIITTTKNIKNAATKKVMLNFKNLKSIKANSGSDLVSTNQLSFQDLTINTSSGADINLDLIANSVICNTSAGSVAKLKGKTSSLKANSSSASNIKVRELKAKNVKANASSRSDITVFASLKLNANVNSGADIIYYGNPKEVSTNDNSSGNVIKR